MSICYLNPGPSVILGCGPGVHKTLLIQPGKVRVPFLEPKESSVSGGGRYLLVGDDSTLHAQWTGTFCSIHNNDTNGKVRCTGYRKTQAWLNFANQSFVCYSEISPMDAVSSSSSITKNISFHLASELIYNIPPGAMTPPTGKPFCMLFLLRAILALVFSFSKY